MLSRKQLKQVGKTTKVLKFVEENVQVDSLMEDDRKTALVIKDIANSVHPMIQMEEDFPSNHSEGKLPILDLKCSIEIIVKFEHFEKPTASKLVLPAQSALPMKQKRYIHINECGNLGFLPQKWSGMRRKLCLQDYVVGMYYAGSEKFRSDEVRQALARYAGILKADKDGLHPFY